jgi:hypothetical protein
VGHVAPDRPDGTFFNTLVIRPQYRITLRLGELDDLFAQPVDDATHMGRKARLQVLGYFYRPLDHAQSEACYNVVWPYYMTKLHAPPLTEAQADQALLRELKEKVLSIGNLPKPGEFSKLRLPGGYTFSSWWNNATLEPNYEAAFALGSNRAGAEKRYYDANGVLGKLPLVAKVEKFVRGAGWRPAEGVNVYFQLRKPDDLPAFDPARACAEQFNAPPLRESKQGPALAGPATASGAGPKAYDDTHVKNYKIDANADPEKRDPQADNVHVDKGGKRGAAGSATAAPVAGTVFEVAERAGFHVAHGTRPLPHKPYHVAKAVTPDGEKHKHSVRAATNEDGEAGVIFMPSRCGGDRYKFRVYVGPPTLDSDGTEPTAVRADTGTLVVWRTIRLSRYLRKDMPNEGSFPAAVFNAWKAQYPAFTTDWVWKSVGARKNDGTNAGIGIVDMTATGTRDEAPFPTGNAADGTALAKARWEGPARTYAKAWCEFVVDHGAATPENLSDAEHGAALTAGINRAKAGQAAFSVPWNMDEMFFHDGNTPFLINIRHWAEYNARPAVTAAQRVAATHGGTDYRDRMFEMVMYFVEHGMMAHFSQNGLLPGLTVVQSPYGCMWDLFGGLASPTNGTIMTSGVALIHRGCFLWYGEAIYNDIPGNFCYNLSSNCCHEMGHNLYMAHQQLPPPNNGDNAMHDMADVCVMSYGFCEGHYCGKSLMQLRGLDITKF